MRQFANKMTRDLVANWENSLVVILNLFTLCFKVFECFSLQIYLDTAIVRFCQFRFRTTDKSKQDCLLPTFRRAQFQHLHALHESISTESRPINFTLSDSKCNVLLLHGNPSHCMERKLTLVSYKVVMQPELGSLIFVDLANLRVENICNA
jgi:hypothetical protein